MRNEGIDPLDSETVALYLTCPGAHIVDLQSYFEIYESIGVVRTLDSRNSLVGILTTPSMLNDCIEILENLQSVIPWRWASRPSEELRQKIFKAAKDA